MSIEGAVVDSKPSKKYKKSKKEKKNNDAVVENEDSKPVNMEGVEPITVDRPKKSKKRKLEATIEEEDGKIKSKKRKAEAQSPPEDTPMDDLPAAVDEKEVKRLRKEAKRKAKELKKAGKQTTQAEQSTSMPTTGQASNPIDVSKYLTENSITITGDVTPLLDFSQLDVHQGLQTYLKKFSKPTPIQACAWPALLAGKDVIGVAETGSGKTLAFGLPLLSRLKIDGSGAKVRALIISPTRELAIQIHDNLQDAGTPLGIQSVCLYGGVSKSDQANLVKGNKQMRIIVGTPGRLLDMANTGDCDFSGVDYLVLDEADRMLERGFQNDILKLISMVKPQQSRQTLMFSATWPESVRKLANTLLKKSHVRITVGSDDLSANVKVDQVVDVFDNPHEKDNKLLKLLRTSQKKTIKEGSDEYRTLVFVLYKAEAPRVESHLKRQGYTVASIHGDMNQQARIQALEEFKAGKVGILIATDVAARGLDIPNVGMVINYTFPLTVEDYIHRIGRTGRGGKSGKSVTFFTGEKHERALAGELMKVVREAGYESQAEGLRKFPMAIKKKVHPIYGAHYREDTGNQQSKKIVFD